MQAYGKSAMNMSWELSSEDEAMGLLDDHKSKVDLQEHVLLPAAISALMDGRIAWRPDGIPVLLEAR